MSDRQIRVTRASAWADSPAQAMGVRVDARVDDEWVTIDVALDESIKGYMIRVNGKEIPLTVRGLGDTP